MTPAGTINEILHNKGGAVWAVSPGTMVYEAIKLRATDIHMEPTREEMHVRFRIDGILQPSDPFSRQMGDAVINIFKVLSNMDITEKRKPQAERQLFVKRVAGATHRVEQRRLAELLAEVTHVDRDDVVALGFALPYPVDQLLPRKDLSRMAQKMLEQLELGRREIELPLAAPRFVHGRFEAKVAKT